MYAPTIQRDRLDDHLLDADLVVDDMRASPIYVRAQLSSAAPVPEFSRMGDRVHTRIDEG
jgi:hypothetical protein